MLHVQRTEVFRDSLDMENGDEIACS